MRAVWRPETRKFPGEPWGSPSGHHPSLSLGERRRASSSLAHSESTSRPYLLEFRVQVWACVYGDMFCFSGAESAVFNKTPNGLLAS